MVGPDHLHHTFTFFPLLPPPSPGPPPLALPPFAAFGGTGAATILPSSYSLFSHSLHSSCVPSGWSSCQVTTRSSAGLMMGPGLAREKRERICLP